MVASIDQRHIEPRQFQISYEMFTTSEIDNEKEATKAHNKSYLAIDIFLSMIDQSIVTNLEYLPDVDQLSEDYFGNNIIVLPEALEGVLLAALHRKFNTITHEFSMVPIVEIKDVDADMTYSLSLEDPETDILPAQEEWLGEYPYWDDPWWTRNDVSTYDNFAETKKEQTLWRKKSKSLHLDLVSQKPLEMIEKNINMLAARENPAEVIDVDFVEDNKTWKPRLV